MKVGIVVFPGSNCEFDVAEAVRSCGGEPEMLWHRDSTVGQVDAVILPGGFSYGDYLRPGAIARFSPIMQAIQEFSVQGRPVLGICNGFQMLTEAGLLPGALQKNQGLKFLCQPASLEVVTANTPFTAGALIPQNVSIPINHFEGNYTCSPEVLQQLQDEDRIVFRYAENPNGSVDRIAGICNENRNVLGLMPHPERAISEILGSTDGRLLFDSLFGA